MIKVNSDRILVATGDPNGIGPEIAVKAALALAEESALRPLLVGDVHVVEPLAKAQGARLACTAANWGRGDGWVDLAPVGSLTEGAQKSGKVTAEAGAATVAYVQAALKMVQEGIGRAIVGCPHSETAVNASGRMFSGYPNLLAELLGTGPDSVFMILVGGGLRIIHVTLHEGIVGALTRLSPELIVRAVEAGTDALEQLGIHNPHIGLFGINPHASEGGLFGLEDESIVIPAREMLRAKDLNVDGPEGADVMLVRPGYDAYVAMYHDQGHIPIKLMAGRTSSALSVGGGIVFSSVGHGAAFDIAGQGIADPEAIIRTIKLLEAGNDYHDFSSAYGHRIRLQRGGNRAGRSRASRLCHSLFLP